ncbi:MAG: DUF1761 domain-containing protein [Prolixibacteraceae bacterium]
MELTSLVENIHWIPVLLMTIFSFVTGFTWHQPFLFGKAWKAGNNITSAKQGINATLFFSGTVIVHFIALAALSAVVLNQGMVSGIIAGFLISIFWILPAMTGTNLFASRPLKLLTIDAGMYILLFSVSGLVLGIH